MMKTFIVAKRDFLATVLTKGFIVGVLIMPILMTGAAPLAMMLMNRKPPPVEGEIAIIDRSAGETQAGATQELRKTLSPDGIEAWVRDQAEEATKAVVEKLDKNVPPGQADQVRPMMEAAAKQVAVPKLTVSFLPPATDPESVKPRLLDKKPDGLKLLALVVVDPDALVRAPGKEEFGTYVMSIRSRLDVRVQGLIRAKLREAVVNARVAANGENPDVIRSLVQFSPPTPETWTEGGAKSGGEMAQMMVPVAFMMLLWISTFTGGQFLLTSTIEEKSNRIMEVLLSAVSPLELMVGKIIGQMCAGLMILILYSSLGIAGLFVFKYTHLIDWGNLALLVVLFLLSFGFIACLMAAVGSAVNDIHEAQSLMLPVTLVIVTPMLLMMPIIFDPNGALATVMTFLPGVGPFVLVLRICSSDPPALWQIILSTALAAVYVTVLAKIAAKIFRVGVLMYGKAPNFATLIRWIKMA